ncbi:MAG: hypothetical protein E7183_00025 [Erysipelotrichaceae bacterium]|nr:hypothetical protein [Erysipelotrichaceae bacterium]
MKNYLLIVEGEVTESTIFEYIFNKLGYSVNKIEGRLTLSNDFKDLTVKSLIEDKDSVTIIQGPKNRINELIKLFENEQYDIKRIFTNLNINFAAVFWIYDVDHTSCENLSKMFNRYNNENDGLLLVSSPCIEILSRPEYNDVLEVEHLKQFKSATNVYIDNLYHTNAKDYIKENFFKLSIEYLDRNYLEFKELNIMEHPGLIINKINNLNERTDTWVKYRYYTTVVYVVVAYILGLTKEIENYELVRKFFNEKKE